MGARATRLSDLKIKAAKPKDKDYTLTDGGGLQLRNRPSCDWDLTRQAGLQPSSQPTICPEWGRRPLILAAYQLFRF